MQAKIDTTCEISILQLGMSINILCTLDQLDTLIHNQGAEMSCMCVCTKSVCVRNTEPETTFKQSFVYLPC